MRVYEQKNPGEGTFRRPPLAKFDADAARGAIGAREAEVRQRVMLKQAVVGKSHLDIIITPTEQHCLVPVYNKDTRRHRIEREKKKKSLGAKTNN